MQVTAKSLSDLGAGDGAKSVFLINPDIMYITLIDVKLSA